MKTNPILITIAKIASHNCGCSVAAMKRKNPIGPRLPKEVTMAQGAALYLTKYYGLKLKEMSDYLNIGYGNASVTRVKFEREVSQMQMAQLMLEAKRVLEP